MLKAILFDFDGVIADSEPIHFKGFQKVLADVGVTLTKSDYMKNYLGYDDEACLKQVFHDRRKSLSNGQLRQLIAAKTRWVKATLRAKPVLLPGARRVIPMLGRRYPLAIVSGALRQEIQIVLRQAKLQKYFKVLVAAEDVKKGKPAPEGFLKAKKLLDGRLRSGECLVIEDSHWGIEAAHRAKMPCVAVTTSYPKKALRAADFIVKGLQEISLATLPKLEKLGSS